MADTMTTLVNELVQGYQFDIDSTTALSLLNRAHKRMVRRARLREGTVSLGNTVAGQTDYTLDGHGVLEVLDLTVDGVPYDRAPRRAQDAYARGNLQWWPSDKGLFVDTADGSGNGQIGLIPPPSAAGLAIVVFGKLEAPTLLTGGTVLVSEDYSDALVAGAAATLLRREPEQLGTAQALDQLFDNACSELKEQAARQKRGSGPARLQIQTGHRG